MTKHKFLTLCVALLATTALWASNTITYKATAKLTGLTVDNTTFGPAITSHTFSNGTGTITCSGEITTIGNYAFYNCSGLTSVTIPNSVTTIGKNAFYGCSGLTSVTIPNSVSTIGKDAFFGCSGLTLVTINSNALCGKDYTSSSNFKTIFGSQVKKYIIGDSVTTIGKYAFYWCTSLTSVTIGNSVTTIGEGAFDDCSRLTKTNYTGTIAEWCQIKMDGYLNNPMFYSHNFYINDVEVKDLVIPEGVTTIGKNAFSGCSRLTSVTIPNSVTTIGNYAFWGCSGLTSITIPNSVTTIASEAFYGCTGLTSITCNAIVPPTCGSNCFYNVSKSIPVYVPILSMDAYKQANEWKDFNRYFSIEEVSVSVNDSAFGSAQGGGHQPSENVTITATANYSYHFVQWNDGNTDNPRSFVLTQDTTFTAEFAINIYSFDVQTADSIMGSVMGTKGNYEHGTSLEISAIPNYGYHFTKWSDGNTDNPRNVQVTADTSFIAQFDKNQYVVTANKGEHIQSVVGAGTYDYLDEVTLSVTPNLGYHFTQWNDGNIENPRSFVVTQDTIFSAQIDTIWSGQCGDDLTWKYGDGVLVISGTGTMYDYTQDTAPWMPLFKESISSLVINNGCTSIGNFAFYGLSNKNLKTIDLPNSINQIGQYAFANCEYLKNLYLGLSLEKIAANAFANDERLLYITCYAIEPPLLDESAFANYDIYLKVPCDVQDEYKVAKGWKKFNKENVSCIGAEEKSVATDEVTVAPEANQATFTWPQNDQAAGYSIEITKDSVVFCTLKFNAQGQLIGIAFAPSRGGQAREMPAATMTANGWQFTVTGLNQASKYGYTLDAVNASQQSIKHYEGEFATDGYVGLYTLPYEGKDGIGSAKFIRNNQLLIRHNGNLYNAAGHKMR